MRRADDYRVSGNQRRGVQTNFAGYEVDLLIVFQLEIDDAALPERRHGRAGLRIQSDQAVARGDVENPVFFAVGPPGEPASRKLPRGRCAARSFRMR